MRRPPAVAVPTQVPADPIRSAAAGKRRHARASTHRRSRYAWGAGARRTRAICVLPRRTKCSKLAASDRRHPRMTHRGSARQRTLIRTPLQSRES
jgi:hypothetical protein